MKENALKQIGLKVKALRERDGLSQEKLADICDVSWRTVSNLECAKGTPDLRFVVALAEHFRLSIDELLSFDANSQKSVHRLSKEKSLAAKIENLDDNLLDFITKVVDSALECALSDKH